MADLYINTTHEGTKHSRGECFSISHIPTGGVINDLLPVVRLSFGNPGYSKCISTCWQLILQHCKLVINYHRLYLDISVSAFDHS